MKASELRQKQASELQEILGEKKSRLDDLRFTLRQKKVKNFKEISVVKKDIARILTLLKATQN